MRPIEIDLRSDTVTRPCAAMRRAMSEAEVGDDVYGEDPTVRRLEARVAELLGQEAGLFVTSGTQGNVCAILTHCRPGDEILIGESGHSFRYEGGAPSALGGVQTHPMPVLADGTIDLDDLLGRLRPPDIHHPPQRLLVLENTKDGRVLPLEFLDAAERLVEPRCLGGEPLLAHLDGARLFNAAVALDEEPERLCRLFDSVTVCLSKGLGAPAGSVLCGSRDFVEAARRWRKMLGGGLRQGGVLAAAGLVAVDRCAELARDHELAVLLAEQLAKVEGLTVERVSTNMVYVTFSLDRRSYTELVQRLKLEGLVLPGPGGLGEQVTGARLVTHRDLPADTPNRVAQALRGAFA